LGIDFEKGAQGKSLLIIGGGGGVGSIAIQLAKLANLTVIATASRPQTVKWVLGFGADFMADHRKPLAAQLTELHHKEVDYIANFADTDQYWTTMAGVIRPEGHIVSIVENSNPVDVLLLKSKSASFHWTFMFTRSMFQTPDMARQGALLNRVSELIDLARFAPPTTKRSGRSMRRISARFTPNRKRNCYRQNACWRPGWRESFSMCTTAPDVVARPSSPHRYLPVSRPPPSGDQASDSYARKRPIGRRATTRQPAEYPS
jgi:NADPH:quinone reductase-like Zn-dependent oxidoreductase